MNIVLMAVGSRGDVQPYLALGRGLRGRGHSVRVVTFKRYQPMVAAAGLDGVALSTDHAAPGKAGPVKAGLKEYRQAMDELFDGLVEATEACAGADVIAYSHIGLAGQSIAKSRGILGCQVLMHPPVPAVPGQPKHLVSYHLTLRGLWLLIRPAVNRWRREVLGLAPMGLFPERELAAEPTLFGYSPSTVPPDRHRRAHRQVTGAWLTMTPDDWAPPEDLADFLAAGPPPVYVGFDQISQWSDREQALQTVVGAVRAAGFRALIWHAGAEPLPDDDLFVVDDVPHDWLFERVAAVVHHGGAGTMATALRAGAPAVVVPAWADQPFWADRVAALGAGVALPEIHKLGPGELAAAIRSAAGDPRLRARAAAVAGRMAAEDGVGRACDLIEEWAPR